MIPDNNNKDQTRNLVTFFMMSLLLILGWNMFFPAQKITPNNNDVAKSTEVIVANTQTPAVNMDKIELAATPFPNSKEITVTTDNYLAKIDEATGDIISLELLKHHAQDKPDAPMTLLDKDIHYTAQSRLIDSNNQFFLEKVPFTSSVSHYQLNDQNQIEVVLGKTSGDVTVQKVITFKKNSYFIDFKYSISNHQSNPLNLTAMYRLLHDGTPAAKGNFFINFYTGPVIYTDENKFSKVSFDDISKHKANFPKMSDNGWLGIIQHHFASIFFLQKSICQTNQCQFYFNQRQTDKLYEIAFTTPLPSIASNDIKEVNVGLFSGPQEYNTLTSTSYEAKNLSKIKDYGMWYVFANPLFQTLRYIESIVGNWGWAIILLVILLKIILYPLNAASIRSMAKMRQVAPKMQAIKEEYGDDKMKMQQKIMELYKTEKINPLGGCLPMLFQIPIFIGLYWAIFNSVELRGAPWIGWITDLSKSDPYYILPILMAATMYLQTRLNPAPTDPMQAKMMKIIPLVFSIMFFFFPTGLVLYWLVNNVLTISQQWFINKSIGK